MGELNLARCNYYQGVGSCSFGCHEEPACLTDRPEGGWPEVEWHPMELANRRARRLAYRTRNWLAWVIFRPYPDHLRTYVSEHAYKPPSRHDVLRWMNTPAPLGGKEGEGT